jgi:hypothetical protein
MDIVLQASYTLVTGVIKVFPLPYNFSPLYSYSSYIFVNNKNSMIATVLMIALLILTDLILNLIYPVNTFPGLFWLYSHPIHILNGFLSKYIIKKNDQIINIGVTSTLTALNFFFLSNFGYFLTRYSFIKIVKNSQWQIFQKHT